jgi:hypothetical protein
MWRHRSVSGAGGENNYQQWHRRKRGNNGGGIISWRKWHRASAKKKRINSQQRNGVSAYQRP